MATIEPVRRCSNARLGLFIAVAAGFGFLVVWQLFSVQVLRSDYYQGRASQIQIKSYEIEAPRGLIWAHNGDQLAPLVLNERRWLAFSDNLFLDNDDDVNDLVGTLNLYQIDVSQETIAKLASDDRHAYIVLARGLTDDQKESIQATKTGGIFFQKQAIRFYIEQNLAANVLGFLNRDSVGQYGVEQQFHDRLVGQPGFVKALTDVRGVPLTLEESNVRTAPIPGEDIVLTLDIPLQRVAEESLAATIKNTAAVGGNLVVIDAANGAVKALANYPGFNPGLYQQTDRSDFINEAISYVVEPASTIKTLTMATALDQGVVSIDQTFNNPDSIYVDGHRIRNFTDADSGPTALEDILIESLNTGSTWLLQQLGGGDFSPEGRQILYDYFSQRFRLGQKTGIDLPGEVSGQVHRPDEGPARDLRYSNMTFGQGLTATTIQMAAAYGAIFNGGDYYRPFVVEKVGDQTIEPTLVRPSILEPKTIASIRTLFERMGQESYSDIQHPQLDISAKTGSGQIAAAGGYLSDVANGLIAGYVSSGQKTYVIVVVVNRPSVRYAGTQGAGPVFRDIVRHFINTGRAIND